MRHDSMEERSWIRMFHTGQGEGDARDSLADDKVWSISPAV